MNGEKVIAVAKREIGYMEFPFGSNKTKFGKWFGMDEKSWCGIFVSWCYAMAGFPLGNIGYLKGYAGCDTAYQHFKAKGELTTDPQRGDIFLVDWNNDGKFDHTGIFDCWIVKGSSFRTIEGNTSMNNDSNGEGVMDRVRYTTKKFVFIHPKVLDK